LLDQEAHEFLTLFEVEGVDTLSNAPGEELNFARQPVVDGEFLVLRQECLPLLLELSLAAVHLLTPSLELGELNRLHLDIERRRLVRETEKAGPMADAVVTLLLNTGLRVDELVTLTWQRVNFRAHSGWIDIVGKGDKRRRLPLNVEARKALEAIQPVPVDDVEGAVFRGKRGPYTARGIEYLVAELGRRAQVPNLLRGLRPEAVAPSRGS